VAANFSGRIGGGFGGGEVPMWWRLDVAIIGVWLMPCVREIFLLLDYLTVFQICWDLQDSFWVSVGVQICWDLQVFVYLIDLYCIGVDGLEVVCRVWLVLWIFWFSDYFQICWGLQKSMSLVDLYCVGGDWFSSGHINLCLMELLLNSDGPINFASRSGVSV
jgi:hypothetical protein